MQPNYNCDQGTQFPSPAPGLFGYGENYISPGAPSFKWSLMDEVWIPEDLEPGAYTLSFRSYLNTFSCPDNQTKPNLIAKDGILRTNVVVFVQSVR